MTFFFFFASDFTHKNSSHTAQVPESKGRDRENCELPAVREDYVQDNLRNVKVQKFMGPDEMHPKALKKLPDVAAKPLSILFEESWQHSEIPSD